MDGTGDVELSNDLSEIMECVRHRMHVSFAPVVRSEPSRQVLGTRC